MAYSSPKLNKVLLPAVIIIWLLIVLRFLGVFEGEEKVQENIAATHLIENIQQDTFSLLLNYPDPFLGDLPEVETQKAPRRRVSSGPKLIPVQKKTPLKLPKLAFQGLVQRDSMAATAILKIDNKLISVREGEVVSGLFIKSISAFKMEISVQDTLISLIR